MGSGLLGRESTGGLDEAGRLIKAIGFASKAGLEGKESGGGDIREVATGEFVANAAEVFAEQFDAGATGHFAVVGQGLEFESAEVGDTVVVAAAPGDEGGFGDADLFGDAGVGPALSAEFDEAVNEFRRF